MNAEVKHPLRTAVIIPAGGRGTRVGGKIPKQFTRIGEESILERTLRAFHRHPLVVEIIVACSLEHRNRVGRCLEQLRKGILTATAPGGPDRQTSVWNAMQAIRSEAEIVLIHDAVRPFVTRELISGVIEAAGRYGAAVAAIPARDTLLRQGSGGMIDGVIDRTSCWLAQTPQAFRRELILRAFRSAQRSDFHGTDDASLVLRLHHDVKVVQGLDGNGKITTPHDLAIARLLVGTRKPRR